VNYEEAVQEGVTRILFMGPRRLSDSVHLFDKNPHHSLGNHRSGKTSIDRVIFQNMSPHETLFLEATAVCDINKTLSNRLTQFQTWDFGGDLFLSTDVEYMNHTISFDTIFKMSNTLVYVIDAQEDDYEDSLPKLAETISVAHKANPNMNFEVFLHKVDGDFMSEETKSERKQVLFSPPFLRSPVPSLLRQAIQSFISSELSEKGNGDVLVSYYLTSIYDHSALEAFSKVSPPPLSVVKPSSLQVVQKLIPQLPTLNSLLDVLIAW
jgi:Ras-related GTP-binding protein C/D